MGARTYAKSIGILSTVRALRDDVSASVLLLTHANQTIRAREFTRVVFKISSAAQVRPNGYQSCERINSPISILPEVITNEMFAFSSVFVKAVKFKTTRLDDVSLIDVSLTDTLY